MKTKTIIPKIETAEVSDFKKGDYVILIAYITPGGNLFSKCLLVNPKKLDAHLMKEQRETLNYAGRWSDRVSALARACIRTIEKELKMGRYAG